MALAVAIKTKMQSSNIHFCHCNLVITKTPITYYEPKISSLDNWCFYLLYQEKLEYDRILFVIDMYYNNLSDFYKNKFGCKVVKLSFDGGFSCPNRVNGSGGCIFCSGSYEFAGDRNKSLEEQYQEQRIVMDKKWPNAKYIAYFGSFTNTF